MSILGIGIGIPWQLAKLAGSAAISYLLRAIFADAPNQTFTNGQALDTETEGVFDGELVINMNADVSASASVSSGVLSVYSANVSTDFCDIQRQTAFDRTPGRLLVFDTNAGSGNPVLGLFTDLTSRCSTVGGFAYADLGGAYYLYVDGSAKLLSPPFAEGSKAAFLEFDDGFMGFLVDYGSGFDILALFPVTTETLYARATPYQNGGTLKLDGVIIPDTLYTEQITPQSSSTPSAPTVSGWTNTGALSVSNDAQAIIYGVEHTGSDQDHEVLFRGSDFGSGAIVQYDASANTLKVLEDSTQRGATITSAQAVGSTIKHQIQNDGASVFVTVSNSTSLLSTSLVDYASSTYVCNGRHFYTDASNYSHINSIKSWVKNGHTFSGID